MKKYRILWEKKQLGNTIVEANSKKEAKKIANETTVEDIYWFASDVNVIDAYTFVVEDK